MSSSALDRLLAGLIAAQVVTGLASLRAGVPATSAVFWLHGILGGALLVAAVEKLRRSLGPALRRRRWGRLALGALLALLVAAGFGRRVHLGRVRTQSTRNTRAFALAPARVETY